LLFPTVTTRVVALATTKKHPRDLSDEDVASLVADLDAAVKRGEVSVVGKRALAAVRAAASRRREAEERVEAAVLTAREEGLSWGLIGAQLGITRQGARQRFESLLER
jgi:hypothetical protein